jgi:isopenicillin N synthase-like dioxygenase
VPAESLQRAYSLSAKFFDQPTEKKLKLNWTTPEANRGYSSPGREKVSQLKDIREVDKIRNAAPDLKESYEIGRDDEPGHPNQWPQEEGEIVGFRSDMLEFYHQCKGLHVEVMRAIAVGMGLDESFFDGFTDVGDNTLRLLHYPAVEADVFKMNPLTVRAGEHSVSVVFTCLLTRSLTLPGLRFHHSTFPRQPWWTPSKESNRAVR